MKRRHFLATSTLAGSWSLLSPFARAQGANDAVRVAVIGLNGRGKGLAKQVTECRGARLVAICDVDSAVLDKIAADFEKQDLKPAKYDDYRKLCESPDIDAVVIATPNHTHALIGTTAAAHGKHAYVEKPVSHNVWEGRQLANAAAKHKVIIQHGFQRRSEPSWKEALAWVAEGNIGKMTLARGLCYKPRPSIGHVGTPTAPPATVNYDLWSGPREPVPVPRKRFHYDWHWQLAYGNGDLGNQGPHQLDVCRWAIGDAGLPPSVISAGARLGYEDDGEWPNTQIVWFDYDPVPILFEVRGLPKSGLDYKGGMDRFKDEEIGNIIECEGGWLAGGHDANCAVYDTSGKLVRRFQGGRSHMQNFIDAVRDGRIDPLRNAETGHLSSALAHVGNISWLLGKERQDGANAFPSGPAADAFERMAAHLEANGVDLAKRSIKVGPVLTMNPAEEMFTGDHAEQANMHLKGSYRSGFEIEV